MSYRLSEPDTCSTIPSIKSVLVHYEKGQEGLISQRTKETIILFRKGLAYSDGMKRRERSVGLSRVWRVLRWEEMRFHWGQF